jgi:Spy/CpxP family protein refolding chaperone
MRKEIKMAFPLLALTISVMLVGAYPSRAQTPTQSPTESAQTPNNQRADTNQPGFSNQIPDLRSLNLTQDQIRKIRVINAEMQEERQAANLRIRQARRALAEAVESPTPDQSLIDQRSRELAEAQTGIIRVRAMVEARVLREVLTPEQRAQVIRIRQENQARRQERNQNAPRNGFRFNRRNQDLQRGSNPVPKQTTRP